MTTKPKTTRPNPKRLLIRAIKTEAPDATKSALAAALDLLAHRSEWDHHRARALNSLSDVGIVSTLCPAEQAAAKAARDEERAARQAGGNTRSAVEREVAALTTSSAGTPNSDMAATESFDQHEQVERGYPHEIDHPA